MLRTLLLLCAFLSAGLLTQPADARSREREDRQEQREPAPRDERNRRGHRDGDDAHRGRSGDDDRGHRSERRDGSAAAARQAQQRNGGGRVLAVDPDGAGYRVKVLKDGEVRTHHVVVD